MAGLWNLGEKVSGRVEMISRSAVSVHLTQYEPALLSTIFPAGPSVTLQNIFERELAS
jgi:hypothetical protein